MTTTVIHQPQRGYGYPSTPQVSHGQQHPYPPLQQGNRQPKPHIGKWISTLSPPTNCPPGLEYLTEIDQLLVHQKGDVYEASTGFETNNKYIIKTNMGQNLYLAVEDNNGCTRSCCGSKRPFEFKIFDHTKREVIHITRPLRCSYCCFPCCLQKLEVMSPPGQIIGHVSQEWAFCTSKFRIEDASGECVLRIENKSNIFGDQNFQVLSKDGLTQVGKITKPNHVLVRGAQIVVEKYGISFPKNLDVNIKAILLGASFLIDFMFFEKKANRERARPRRFGAFNE